jgi:hypothetical protein
MATPRQLKDSLKDIVTDIIQRHATAAIAEIATVMADELEALAADRVAELRAQPESETDQPQLFPELEESPPAAQLEQPYDGERDIWGGTTEAYAEIRARQAAGGGGWSPR